MQHIHRRRMTVLVAVAAALAFPLLVPAAAQAAPAPTAAITRVPSGDVVKTALPCGTASVPCLSLRDVVCWEDNACRVNIAVFPYTQRSIQVGFATKDGTAVSGVNYRATEGKLAIPAGSESAAVIVPVGSSRTPTGAPAYFYLTLYNSVGGVIQNDTAVVTISVRTG